MFKKVFFPTLPSAWFTSTLLLLARLFIGILFLSHGMQKWLMYASISQDFPDPLHIGSAFSLILTIITEVVCSFFFIFGFMYRLVLLPMIFAMGMAFFVVHDGSLDGGELSLIYMMTFVFMYFVGPGNFSMDAWLKHRLEEAVSGKSK